MCLGSLPCCRHDRYLKLRLRFANKIVFKSVNITNTIHPWSSERNKTRLVLQYWWHLCNEQFGSCYSLLGQEERWSYVYCPVQCLFEFALLQMWRILDVHAVKVYWTEQNAQYFIGQSIVTSTEWYTSLGKISHHRFLSVFRHLFHLLSRIFGSTTNRIPEQWVRSFRLRISY
jgi:hypothetical protein